MGRWGRVFTVWLITAPTMQRKTLLTISRWKPMYQEASQMLNSDLCTMISVLQGTNCVLSHLSTRLNTCAHTHAHARAESLTLLDPLYEESQVNPRECRGVRVCEGCGRVVPETWRPRQRQGVPREAVDGACALPGFCRTCCSFENSASFLGKQVFTFKYLNFLV